MQKERSRMLGEMPMRRLVPTVSVPIMISMLVQALYNIIDSIFVAQYDPTALSAVNLAAPLQMLMIALSVGMGTGMGSVISRRLGERNGPEARRAAMNGLFVEGCSWLLFVVIGGVVYYIVMTVILWLKLNPNDLKLFTAILVAVFLAVPYLQGQRTSSFRLAGRQSAARRRALQAAEKEGK